MISHHKDNQNLCCNTDANEHSGHSSYMRNHGSARDFLRRFFIVTFLLIPLLFFPVFPELLKEYSLLVLVFGFFQCLEYET